MKNIIKIALVMLSVLSFSAAQAGVLEVTGSAKASYTIVSSDSTTAKQEKAKGLGVANEFNLGASGELDNGWTWKYNVNIDDATVQDDAGLSLGTPFGGFAINISQGGLELSKAASITATGNRASDSGFDEGMKEEHSISNMNHIEYSLPAGLLPFGIGAKIAYAPDTTADATASVNKIGGSVTGGFTVPGTVTSSQGDNIGRTMTAYQITAAPIAGLNIGASYEEYDGVVGGTVIAQQPESGSWYAKYAYGPATVAYGQAWRAEALTTASTDFIEYFANNKLSVAFNVNENLSVSYSEEKSTAHHKTAATTDVELKSTSIAGAYTMGGMTFAVALLDHENVGYAANVDASSTVFNVSMAF